MYCTHAHSTRPVASRTESEAPHLVYVIEYSIPKYYKKLKNVVKSLNILYFKNFISFVLANQGIYKVEKSCEAHFTHSFFKTGRYFVDWRKSGSLMCEILKIFRKKGSRSVLYLFVEEPMQPFKKLCAILSRKIYW